MKVLVLGFKGKYNSASLVLERLNNINYHKISVSNSFNKSIEEFNHAYNKSFDYIIVLGSNKNLKNEIVLEKSARLGNKLYSELDLNAIKGEILKKRINVSINDNPSNYLCNNLYYHVLNVNRKSLLIHIPTLPKIANLDLLSNIINKILEE